MKNKIILLLVLLIPSLCFGESLSISITTDLNFTKTQIIAITSSKYKNEKVFNLKLHLGNISVSDNQKEFNEIDQYLIKVGLGRLKTMGKTLLTARATEYYIEKNAVINNWQVTEIAKNETRSYWKIYLYRPDK
jgi:hypothetical protein